MIGYILASDVAHIHKISLNHVYVLACTKRWGRYRDSTGRVRYRIDDVAATFDKEESDTQGSKDATERQIMP